MPRNACLMFIYKVQQNSYLVLYVRVRDEVYIRSLVSRSIWLSDCIFYTEVFYLSVIS